MTEATFILLTVLAMLVFGVRNPVLLVVGVAFFLLIHINLHV